MNDVPASPLTLPEAAAITDLPLGLVAELLPPTDGLVSLREALYAALLAELCMLEPAAGLMIARTAALEAKPNGTRLLCVAWQDGQPTGSWIEDDIQPARPVLIVPAEAMLNTIAERLIALRTPKQRHH